MKAMFCLPFLLFPGLTLADAVNVLTETRVSYLIHSLASNHGEKVQISFVLIPFLIL